MQNSENNLIQSPAQIELENRKKSAVAAIEKILKMHNLRMMISSESRANPDGSVTIYAITRFFDTAPQFAASSAERPETTN